MLRRLVVLTVRVVGATFGRDSRLDQVEWF